MLGEYLEESGIRVEHAAADADVLIVNVALERARTKPTVLLGNDTDLSVLLLYKFAPDTMEDIILYSKQRIISIKTLQAEVKCKSPEIIESILFLHAFSGCDTCSSPLGVGKLGTVAKVAKLAPFARVFMDSTATKEQIFDSGEQAMCVLYGLEHISLDLGRSNKYRERVITATQAVEVQKLPPTSDACQQHSLRVYHQIQAWLENDLPPTDFGWEERLLPNGENTLRPVRMIKPAAPSDLLKIIRCGCKEEACATNLCSCFKAGLSCTKACRNCKGTSCHNTGVNEDDVDDEDE